MSSKRKTEKVITEKVITESIQRALKVRAIWAYKVPGGYYGINGVPDLLCCANGRFVALEVKRPGNKPTKLQEFRIAEIRASGGVAEVVESKEEAVKIVERVLAV